jgi:hypothetical protein
MNQLILFILYLGFLLLWITQQFSSNSMQNYSSREGLLEEGGITALSIGQQFYLGLSPKLGCFFNKTNTLLVGLNFQYYSLKNVVEFKIIENPLNFRTYLPSPGSLLGYVFLKVQPNYFFNVEIDGIKIKNNRFSN